MSPGLHQVVNKRVSSLCIVMVVQVSFKLISLWIDVVTQKLKKLRAPSEVSSDLFVTIPRRYTICTIYTIYTICWRWQ